LASFTRLFVIFVGYLSLRAFVEDPEQRARWSSAVGILGFLNVPIVYLSVRWWRTLHQPGSSPATVDPAYAWGLRANAFAFLFVMLFLMVRRYQAAVMESEIDAIEEDEALFPGRNQ
jgi:heme exporter protein C